MPMGFWSKKTPAVLLCILIWCQCKYKEKEEVNDKGENSDITLLDGSKKRDTPRSETNEKKWEK